MIWDRKLWRIARRLEAAYRQAQQEQTACVLPAAPWQDLQRGFLRLGLAESRGWQHAAARESATAIAGLQQLTCQLRELTITLQRSGPRLVPPTRTLYEELLAVSDEFAPMKADEEGLQVTTEPILLEGIELGRFVICLKFDKLGRDCPYSVLALEPHPAASSSDTMHPHVANDKLCPGEGRAPIAAALAEGRLFDFFVIVDRILHTYAAGSAFVELDRWNGVPCHDCDCLMEEDETYCCPRCEESVCGDCLSGCSACSTGYCSGCIDACRQCEERYCQGCLGFCQRCHREFCPFCLEDTLCHDCRQELQHEDHEEPETTRGHSGQGASTLSEI